MVFRIEGMMCKNCVKHVKEAIESLGSVTAEVDLERQEAVVTGDESITAETIINAIEEEGYKAEKMV